MLERVHSDRATGGDASSLQENTRMMTGLTILSIESEDVDLNVYLCGHTHVARELWVNRVIRLPILLLVS